MHRPVSHPFLACALLVVAALQARSAATAQDAQKAPDKPYRYVSLGTAPGYDFLDPVGFTEASDVVVNGYKCTETCTSDVLVRHNGTFGKLSTGTATATSQHVIGGFVDLDPNPEAPTTQAALFRGKQVTRIPLLAGEISSTVLKVSNNGLALVEATAQQGDVTRHYLFEGGRLERLDFGGAVSQLDLNERRQVSGTLNGSRAFRYDVRARKLDVLPPIAGDPSSWGLGISAAGNVLGYSFLGGGIEHIGVWRDRTFETWFVEGTPEFPTISNKLVWNERGLIVITNTTRADPSSYLVPRPGVRQNLNTLADGIPRWTSITAVSIDGNILGVGGAQYFSADDAFVLVRTSH